jgi:asparagine synthase (glutamine-hydrolysing)
VSDNNTKIRISCLHAFNFDKKRYADQDAISNAKNLASLFAVACKNRADRDGNNVISLSGGFDSRTVAACLYKNKIPFSSATYVQPGWRPSVGTLTEVEIARQVANLFGCELKNYGVIEAEPRDYYTLLRIKFGLNYLEFSYLIPIMEQLKLQYRGSEVVFFTGDGGDRLLPRLIPSRKLKNIEDLVSDIIDRFGGIFFPIEDVAAMTQIREDRIAEELRNVISSYPEENLYQKFVHFMLYEAAFNDLFESEDRNRAYFWSVSPYYSVPFFDYAMNCSDDVKSYSRLQKQFLLEISSSSAAIDKAEYGCSILSKRYRLIEFVVSLQQRYPKLARIIGKIRRNKGRKENPKMIKCLRDQLSSCESIWSYFVRDNLEHILNNSEKYNPSGISVLFTITSLVETLFCSERSIKKNFI